MFKLNQKLLYFVAGAAFVFALLKYFFVNSSLSGFFISIETISFILFLGTIYIADRVLQLLSTERINHQTLVKDINRKHALELKEIEQELNAFRKQEESVLEDDALIQEIKLEISNIQNSSDPDRNEFSQLLLVLSHFFQFGLGICYAKEKPSGDFSVKAQYGLSDELIIPSFIQGEGFNGQAVIDQQAIVINDIDDDYMEIESCSGSAQPTNLYLLPLVSENETIALIELGSFADIRINQYWNKINDVIIDSKIFK